MKRHVHSFMWFLYWLLAFVCVLLAGAIFVIKILIDDIHLYSADVEQFLSSQLNAEVSFTEIEGHWIDWQPSISLKGLAIKGSFERPELAFSLMQGDIQLDPAASLRSFFPVFSKLDLHGLTVEYDLARAPVEKDQGVIGGPSEQRVEPGYARSGVLAFLLHQRTINMSEARIVVQPVEGDAVSLAPIQLSLQHDGLMHQLKIDADLVSNEKRSSIRFIAEVEGRPSKNAVDFYFKLADIDQQLLNPWLSLANIQLDSLDADQEIWGQSYRGRLIYLSGKTAIHKLQYQDYGVEQLTVQTSLNRRGTDYQVQVTNFQIASEHKNIDIPRISLDLTRKNGLLMPRRLMVDEVELDTIFDWLLMQPFLSEELSSMFHALSPMGVLRNFVVSWAEPFTLRDFDLEADLVDVGINAWADVPEIKGINGLLLVNSEGGEIHLQSKDFVMHYPALFDEGWSYSRAKGVIGWRFEDRGVVVASQLLTLGNLDLSASGRFSIYLPFSSDEQPLLNLQIGLQEADALQAEHYIPPREVGRSTYEWLVTAIKSGVIKRAGFVLNGVTRSRLPDYQLPVVQLFFDVDDVSFEYQLGWPAINDANGFIYFRNGELLAEAVNGGIYNSVVDFAWVHLPQAAEKLLVVGGVNGDGADIQRLLTESDLKEEVGDDLSDWSMSGKTSTLVNLNIPLEGAVAPNVLVASVIEQGRFQSIKDKIDFSQISGEIRYDSMLGLSSGPLKASLFNQPVAANIATAIVSKNLQKTEINIKSHIAIERLSQWLDLDHLSFLEGRFAYHARLDLCPDSVCNQLVINSDLKGVAINAPPPLNKTESQIMPLTIMSDLGRTYTDGRSAIRINLADQLRGVIVSDVKGLERARFSLGGARPEVPSDSGIWVDGVLASVDYAELAAFIARLEGGSASVQHTDLSTDKLLRRVDLLFDHFSVGKYALEDITLSLVSDTLGWMLEAQSDALSGKVWMPDAIDSPYKVELQRLSLSQGDEMAESGSAALFDATEINADSVPAIDFNIETFFIDDKPLGHWRFKLRPHENDVRIDDITADIHGAQIRGELRWVAGVDQTSDLTLKLNSGDLSALLKALNVSAIETKSLDAYLQLSWQGAPWAFDMSEVDGELQFTAKQGRILDVGKSGNILRVFGILNLQSLGRRLRLDFTDLVKSGVAFDEMKASYRIKKGIAQTSTPFIMVGPSANMVMEGSLNLVEETVNKDIEVALPVTDNIPLMSVLLGAPQVAGAVFLFDKLLGDPLAKFTTVKYNMSGDWSEPSIVIDDGKATKPVNDNPSVILDSDHG